MTEQEQKQESPLQTPAEPPTPPKAETYQGLGSLLAGAIDHIREAMQGHAMALNWIADEVGKLNKTVHDGFTALGGVPYPPEEEGE